VSLWESLYGAIEGVAESVSDGVSQYVAGEVNDLVSPSAYEVAANAQADQAAPVTDVAAAAIAAEAAEDAANEPVWMGFNKNQLMIGGGITLAVFLFATRR